MISFFKPAGSKVLELGNGGASHPNTDVRVDKIAVQNTTHFTCDFDMPIWGEIGGDAFDTVLCQCFSQLVTSSTIESFVRQVLRVLKPDGKFIFVSANTDAEGGSRSVEISPSTMARLLMKVGFSKILSSPFGENSKEMAVEALKPATQLTQDELAIHRLEDNGGPVPPEPPPPPLPPPAAEIYTKAYFDKYQSGGWYWDFLQNHLIAQRILENKPESVLELGCARGYVLKRVQDAGVRGDGIDVSKHAWLTRVCDPIGVYDLTNEIAWPAASKEFDLCYSLSFFEHIHEQFLPAMMQELQRVSKRGLHAVAIEGGAPNHDPTRISLKPLDFWKKIMPEGNEVVDIREISNGDIPQEYLKGDGKLRLNLGCAYTLFHGWANIDVVDAENWARAWQYNFVKHDLRNGIPHGTGVVDSLFLHHVLEHFSYDEIARLLKECRRVIRPDGALRVVVPDVCALTNYYTQMDSLKQLDQMNEGCAKSTTDAGKLWAILGEGHKSFLDRQTLLSLLDDAGWTPHSARFRYTEVPAVKDILKGTIEMTYGGTSLFVDATPKLG